MSGDMKRAGSQEISPICNGDYNRRGIMANWVPSYDRACQGFDGDLAAEEASRMAMR